MKKVIKQQFAVSFLLVIVIPSLLVGNLLARSIQFHHELGEVQKSDNSRMTNLITALVSDVLDQPDTIKNRIAQIRSHDPRILEVSVYRYHDDQFEEIVTTVSGGQLQTLRDVHASEIGQANQALVSAEQGSDGHTVWTVADPIIGTSNEKKGLVIAKFNNPVIEDQLSVNDQKSQVLLMVSALISITLIMSYFYISLRHHTEEDDQKKS